MRNINAQLFSSNNINYWLPDQPVAKMMGKKPAVGNGDEPILIEAVPSDWLPGS